MGRLETSNRLKSSVQLIIVNTKMSSYEFLKNMRNTRAVVDTF